MGLVAVETAPSGRAARRHVVLPPGRTEFKGRDGRVDKLADDVVDEHRRGLLHIVGSGVEQGVEGEGWAAVEIVAATTPKATRSTPVSGVALALKGLTRMDTGAGSSSAPRKRANRSSPIRARV